MKRILPLFLPALLSACALLPTDGGTRAVRAEREFSLSEGGRVVVLGPRISVEFVGVPEDSRCPVEARCAVAGNATVRLRLSQAEHEPATVDLRTDQPRSFAAYHGYAVELRALEPERSLSQPDPEYRATLIVGPVFTGGG